MKINKTVLDFWNTHITTMALIVLLLVFIGSSTFFALKLKRAIIPDEPAHFVISKQFSTTWGIPPVVPGNISLGYINHKPFLYYWINGRILDILEWVFPGISDWQKLVSLRLISVIYSLISIVYCYLLAKEIIKNRWWHLLVVFL